jgi:DnaJ-class molecular chaperone
MAECEACNGSGYDDCYHCGSEIECPECDGTGEVEDEKDA